MSMKNMDYKDYWKNENWKKREKRKYYQRLYSRVKRSFVIPANAKILDVGGGDGHLMYFLELKNVDIIDISDSGLEIANKVGFGIIKADIEKEFPISNDSYDAAFCCEVLEHLHSPDIAIAETHRVLKERGILYIAQPNMRADGVHHIRRFYLQDTVNILIKNGFSIEWLDFVPAFTMRDAILDDIKKTSSIFRKFKQSIALILSFLPWRIRYIMARIIPNRFALLFIVKAIKK